MQRAPDSEVPAGPPAPRRFIGLATGAVLLGVIVASCLYAGWLVVTPQDVRQLPGKARAVRWVSMDLFPDSDFYLQAELSDEACRRHVTSRFADFRPLDAVSVPDEEQLWISWGFGPRDDDGNALGWWRGANLSPENTWVDGRPGSWAIVQCFEGHLFLRSFTH